MDRLEPELGSNRPPALRDLIAERTRSITESLDLEGSDLLDRRDDLLAAAARVPEVIEDADTAQRLTDFIGRQLTAFIKQGEARRIADKEPLLSAERALDGWYVKAVDPIRKAKKICEAKLTAWQRAQAEAERRRREEIERKQREEADRLRREAAELAKKLRAEEDLARAMEAERAAQQAAADLAKASAEAKAKASELHVDHGDYGARSSLRTDWVGEIEDRTTLDLEALRQHIPLDALQKALNAYVRAGGRELRGARIYEHVHSVVRG